MKKPNKKSIRHIFYLLFVCFILLFTSFSIMADSKKSLKVSKKRKQKIAKIGETPPDFNLYTYYGGRKITLSKFYKKKKAVLINFFGTWCPYCRTEIQKLVKIYKTYKKRGVGFISIALEKEDPAKTLPAFVKQYKIKWPVLIDYNRKIANDLYKVSGVPKNVIINKKGKISYLRAGMMSEKQLKTELDIGMGIKKRKKKANQGEEGPT